jgi:hypothetical protein
MPQGILPCFYDISFIIEFIQTSRVMLSKAKHLAHIDMYSRK